MLTATRQHITEKTDNRQITPPPGATRYGVVVMTDDARDEITRLQKNGYDYRAIARITQLPETTTKTYLRRNPTVETPVCLCCGKAITQIPHHRKKRFCSKLCKSRWWNTHPHLRKTENLKHYVCPVCGTAFSDYGRRVYCSVHCFSEARKHEHV